MSGIGGALKARYGGEHDFDRRRRLVYGYMADGFGECREWCCSWNNGDAISRNLQTLNQKSKRERERGGPFN